MADTFEFTLDEESEKKLYDILTDINTEKTPSFTITDKYGHTAEYVKMVQCKDCKAYLTETETLASYCPILRIYSLPEDAYCYKAQRKEE